MRSQRQLRVGETLRHALATVFQRGDVPWIEGVDSSLITVTEVRVSPDLHNATAYIMPLGGKDPEGAARALNGIVGFFRHELAKAVEMRYIPKLDFKPDTSFDYAEKIEKILHDPTVARDVSQGE